MLKIAEQARTWHLGTEYITLTLPSSPRASDLCRLRVSWHNDSEAKEIVMSKRSRQLFIALAQLGALVITIVNPLVRVHGGAWVEVTR